MNNLLTFGTAVFTSFFTIMNPILNIPIFLTLVGSADGKIKQKINLKAVIIAFIIVCVFVVLGTFIFELFGITFPAFKIAGGILIFKVGFDMLQSKKSSIKHLSAPVIDENIAVSPLAIPILAGSGTIVTAMNFIPIHNYIHMVVVISAFGLMCLLTYIAFSSSDFIAQKNG